MGNAESLAPDGEAAALAVPSSRDRPAQSPALAPPVVELRSSESPAKGRVLVVDDEVALLRAFARTLSAHGYHVESVMDGLEAKKMLEEGTFDVVVSDVHMPGMTGIELLRAARGGERDVPVILVTGRPGDRLAEEAVEAGALLYLIKPVDPRALVQVVDHARLVRRAAELARANDAAAMSRGDLGARFDRALTSLRMVYQPIVHWPTKSIYGYEALARTSEPTLTNPAVLLHAAESLGRVRDVGRVVRERVAGELERSAASRIFVNVHTAELEDPELFAADAPLSRHGDRVVLEITERGSLDDVRDVPAKVAALRSLGFKIAVDDLGAGYAGLTAFAQLLPEVVKVDMSLVRNVELEPVKRELIRHLAALCGDMGMLVVAEGVEIAAERDVLRQVGCELMQGYLFARPGAGFPTVTW